MRCRCSRWWAGVVVLLLAAGARAQSAAIDVQMFQPVADTLGGFTIGSARPLGHLDWNVGLLTNYAASPLRLRTVSDGAVVRELVSDRVTADVLVALGLGDVFDLALDLPVVVWNDGAGTIGAETLTAAGVGDLRVTARVGHVWGVFGAALVGDVSFPTGDDSAFLGAGGVRGGPRAVLELDFGFLQLIANLGLRFQGEEELANLVVDHELTMGLAVLGRVRSIRLDIVGEAATYTRLQEPFARQTDSGLELRAGLRYGLPGDVVLLAGAGPGIVGGYGTPEWRAFLGLMYAPAAADRSDPDRDGIVGAADTCPTDAEDADGVADADGCPDPDDDGDGIADADDRCRSEAEDADGFEDGDGCPDADNDGDRVPDAADSCPLAAEDADGFADADGCPDPDNDGDGIPDGTDRCPDAAEVVNDVEDEDGCPDPTRVVELTCERIAIRETVRFETGSDRIDPASYPLLDEVAATILLATHVRKVQVEGHTDSEGPDRLNLRLSELRAIAVRKYLVARGVPGGLLTAKGFGETVPIESNSTEEGRALNRRVEFVILEQTTPESCR